MLHAGVHPCVHNGHPLMLCVPTSSVHHRLWPHDQAERQHHHTGHTAGLPDYFIYHPRDRNRLQGTTQNYAGCHSENLLKNYNCHTILLTF